jgi:hypothetical protein
MSTRSNEATENEKCGFEEELCHIIIVLIPRVDTIRRFITSFVGYMSMFMNPLLFLASFMIPFTCVDGL